MAEVDGQWVALLSWSAASYHLKDREQWIGWSDAQRRRLALVANNSRILILPGADCPNLASRVLAQCLSRLSADWQAAYDHPILLVESFVDSQFFRGTCYKAQGWSLLGATRGFERTQQGYYVAHDRPKQLWVRELSPGANARAQLRGTLLSIIIMATLCGIVRGQRDLAAFAAKLTQARLRALRSYLGKDGRYRAPKETTFQRVLSNLDPDAFERILHAWETQLLGPSETSGDKLTAIGGKAQCGSSPEVKNEQQSQLVSAQSLPSGRVLGTVLVETKSNEITAARELLEKIGAGDAKLIDAAELLRDARLYWQIEGGLHQGLDVSAREDSSRVRNRNALRVLGMARRRMMGPYRDWRDRRKNKPQSTLADVYDAMSGHNNRGAWQKIISLG